MCKGTSQKIRTIVVRDRDDCVRFSDASFFDNFSIQRIAIQNDCTIEMIRGSDDRALLTSLPFIRFKRFAWAAQIIDAELRRRHIAVVPSMELDSLEGIASDFIAIGVG